MQDEVMSLQEVVVTGYGVQRKSDVTGAVSSISFGQREGPQWHTVRLPRLWNSIPKDIRPSMKTGIKIR